MIGPGSFINDHEMNQWDTIQDTGTSDAMADDGSHEIPFSEQVKNSRLYNYIHKNYI